MVIMIPVNILPPEIILRRLGSRARERRLEENLSRKTLAAKAGLSEATIKHFELKGRIGVESLLALAIALGCADDFDELFKPPPVRSITDVRQRKRERGRR